MKVPMTDAQAEAVITRSGGLCEVCGKGAEQIHHRRARGMGGTSRHDVHAAPSLLHVCRSCHTWIEHNLAEARDYGWSVSIHEPDPDTIPALVWGRWVWLYDDGAVVPCSVATLRRMDLEDLHYDTEDRI